MKFPGNRHILMISLHLAGFLGLTASAAPESTSRPSDTIVPLDIRTKAFRTQLLPYEPLRLHVTIYNPSTKMQSIDSLWGYYLQFQYRPVGDAEWAELRRFIVFKLATQDPPVPLNGGVTTAGNFWAFPFSGDGTAFFEQGKDYEVRAFLRKGSRYNRDLASPPARVVISLVGDAEAAAFEEVRKAAALTTGKGWEWPALLGGLFSVRSELPLDQYLAQLDGFIQRHPNSAYSTHYRRIYVEAVRFHTPRGQPLPERAAEKERWLKKHAPWIDAAQPPPPPDPATRPAAATRPVGGPRPALSRP